MIDLLFWVFILFSIFYWNKVRGKKITREILKLGFFISEDIKFPKLLKSDLMFFTSSHKGYSKGTIKLSMPLVGIGRVGRGFSTVMIGSVKSAITDNLSFVIRHRKYLSGHEKKDGVAISESEYFLIKNNKEVCVDNHFLNLLVNHDSVLGDLVIFYFDKRIYVYSSKLLYKPRELIVFVAYLEGLERINGVKAL